MLKSVSQIKFKEKHNYYIVHSGKNVVFGDLGNIFIGNKKMKRISPDTKIWVCAEKNWILRGFRQR